MSREFRKAFGSEYDIFSGSMEDSLQNLMGNNFALCQTGKSEFGVRLFGVERSEAEIEGFL